MSAIEWTGLTWNPTTGCDRISPGCDNCYALEMARRLKAMGQAKYQNDGDPRTSGPGFGLTVHADALTIPLRRRKPTTWFVNSMSDLFHARVPVWFVAQVWVTMARTPQHTYQILTKRPERARAIIGEGIDGGCRLFEELHREEDAQILYDTPWPLPNVHLGTSIELDRYARRADELRRTDAAIRFLSLEPLLGPLPSLRLDGIDWVILGGESGPGARPMDLGWVRDLIARCREAGAAVFVKQLGSQWAHENSSSDKGGDWSLWPEDLRVREFPKAQVVA
ncbi:MAG TPA: phage Gp37/Gp68 family protein [Streptosporangiaceae bacterium]|nr:phage Gp37/Gp68 family protein [Streptosporangiaceae bacterium]